MNYFPFQLASYLIENRLVDIHEDLQNINKVFIDEMVELNENETNNK